MSEDERKAFAFLISMVYKMSTGNMPDENEIMQLSNLCDEYGSDDLDQNEFRY